MRRVLRLSELFFRSRTALVRPRSLPSQALAATLARLMESPLPGALDFEALFPTGGVAWVRQVGPSLWVFFHFNDRTVAIVAVVDREPVRVD